jgi:hypothetical protein
VDSKTVSKALRENVRPILRDAGFARFTTRKAWRSDGSTVHVIEFRSLGTYSALGTGATTYSFSGHLGVYYLALNAVPWGEPGNDDGAPEEWVCQARCVLGRELAQAELPRDDIWSVRPDGSNLPAVMGDVVRAVKSEALPWFGYFGDIRNALQAFESQDETFRTGAVQELLGGQPNSAARAQIASALALSLGETERAVAAWRRHLANPFYQRLPEFLDRARKNLSWIEERRAAGA